MAELSEIGKAALAYAETRSWPVFPCLPRKKAPLGRLAPKGFQSATRDLEVIRKWWLQVPDANIGIPTGEETFDAFDVDETKGGVISLREMIAAHDDLPAGPRNITGRGFQHMFIGGSLHRGEVGNTAGLLGAGLDTRTTGGYIVVEPSVHPNGKVYTWEDLEFEIPPPPPWLVDLLCAAAGPAPLGEGSPQGGALDPWRPGPILEGERNDRLFRLGCSLRSSGDDHQAILDFLIDVNERHCEPPLPLREVHLIARSVATRYKPGASWEKFRDQELERWATETAEHVQANGEVSDKLKLAREWMQVPLCGVIQAGRDHADYYLDIEGQGRIHIGKLLRSQTVVGDALMRQLQNTAVLDLTQRRWKRLRQILASVVEVDERLETSRQGEAEMWVEIAENELIPRAPDDYRQAVLQRATAFLHEGSLHLNVQRLSAYLRVKLGNAAPSWDLLCDRLREIGFERHAFSVRDEESQVRTGRYWRRPCSNVGE